MKLTLKLDFIKHRLASIKDTMNLAVNEAYLDMAEVISLKDGDEIAVIPPISGG